MPLKYPSSVRRQACPRLRGGEAVAEIVADTNISPATSKRERLREAERATVQSRLDASALTCCPPPHRFDHGRNGGRAVSPLDGDRSDAAS